MLAPHAKIAVVAPAGPFVPERLTSAWAMMAQSDLQLVESPNLYAVHRYLAGAIDQRLADLTWALTAADLDAVWYARGGFGTAQLLEDLPWESLRVRPTIGFSDATALLTALYARGLPAIHGPVLQGLADPALNFSRGVTVDAQSRDSILHLLLGDVMSPLPGQFLCGPQTAIKAPVTGGNLCVLASMVGTRFQAQTLNHIVLLEDTGEPPYRIDRLLTQLIQAGGLSGAVAIGLGDFDGCEAKNADYTVHDVLRERLEPLNIPVLYGLPFGHTPRNIAFRYGAVAQLDERGLTFTT